MSGIKVKSNKGFENNKWFDKDVGWVMEKDEASAKLYAY